MRLRPRVWVSRTRSPIAPARPRQRHMDSRLARPPAPASPFDVTGVRSEIRATNDCHRHRKQLAPTLRAVTACVPGFPLFRVPLEGFPCALGALSVSRRPLRFRDSSRLLMAYCSASETISAMTSQAVISSSPLLTSLSPSRSVRCSRRAPTWPSSLSALSP
jgi:hypothetical protein